MHHILRLTVIGLALAVYLLGGMSLRAATAYPSAAPLLHRSMSVMQHSVHQAHSDGMIETRSCCPHASTSAHLTGDCVTQPTVASMRFAIRGTMMFGPKTPVVALDFHVILTSSTATRRAGKWIRSRATHNTWQKATAVNTPMYASDLTAYLCPTFLMAQFTQHFPAHLINLGPITIRGVPAWHLQDRLAATRGGLKGTVIESDVYLARSSLQWLRYGSVYGDAQFKQRVVVDYSNFTVPLTISAPQVGSSTP